MELDFWRPVICNQQLVPIFRLHSSVSNLQFERNDLLFKLLFAAHRIKLPSEAMEDPPPDENNTSFKIESVVDGSNPCGPLTKFGNDFSSRFGVEVNQDTHPILLSPGQKIIVTTSFSPVGKPGVQSSVLFIRNNLTGLDVVDLIGVGATGDIKFGNRKTGSTIHAFEMTEKHLKDCDSKSNLVSYISHLTLKL